MSASRCALLSLSALLVTTLWVCKAQADGYIGAGMGSESDLHGDLASHFSTSEETSSSRIIMGQRYGALALEACLFGSQLQGGSALVGDADYSTISLGVDLKYHLGLIGGLEAYGKLGLNKTWLSGPAARQEMDYQGRGNALGLGLQYRFELPLTTVAIWADYTVQRTELRDGQRQALDGELAMANLGLSLGF